MRLEKPFGGGSSPLARGTLGGQRPEDVRRRFIPARAGNTRAGPRSATAGTVHPRSRGEHGVPVAGGGGPHGSSPLARGTHTSGIRRNCFSTVHPRSRGEHTKGGSDLLGLTGSSPLARGTLPEVPSSEYRIRFIPARAGNTAMRRQSRGDMTVHPRSRGEHSWASSGRPRVAGSSPLARGTR